MQFRQEWSLYIAEFIGTFFLVFFGCGAIVLAESGNQELSTIVPFIFGATVSIMIYALGHISGAHLNPAVSFAFWVHHRIHLSRFSL